MIREAAAVSYSFILHRLVATFPRRYLECSIFCPNYRRNSGLCAPQSSVNMLTVQVHEGELRGVEKKLTLSGKPFYAFLGIPFAKPPVGDLRFKAPVPLEKWDGVLDASKDNGIVCLQVDHPQFKTSEPRGSEDCLYLNVYTLQPPGDVGDNKKAVMVYVHGGGFCQGTGSNVGPNFLVDHDVILVTLNYRLHVFGFLNAGTESCPGNAGLKDQLLAIKWVKRNIGSFGGDVDNITLFGESAGAVSIHLQMLSPLSRGLFHKAILQSGNALVPWAIEKDPELYVRKLGRRTGYKGDDLEGMVQHLKNRSAVELCRLADECQIEGKKNCPAFCANVVFIPSVERIKEGAFLPDYPQKLMETAAPIPAIIGFNDQEGLLYYLAQEPHHMDLVLKDLSIVVKDNFNLNKDEQIELLAKMKRFYLGNETLTRNLIPHAINLFGDIYFMKFYEAIDHLIRSNVPPFVYLFAYDGNFNFFKQIYFKPYVDQDIKGAAHADDMGYLFDAGLPVNEADKEMIHQFCTLWTNFAKNGHPTSSLRHVDWKPYTKTHSCYLRIEKELKVFDEKLYEERFDFWKKWSSKFIR